jgi:hypothetical protein
MFWRLLVMRSAAAEVVAIGSLRAIRKLNLRFIIWRGS